MRKNIILMAATFLAAATFTSCNVEDEINEPSNQPVQFNAVIGEIASPQTRAAGTDWENGDAIGIFMVENGTTNIVGDAANKRYTTTNIAAGPSNASTFSSETTDAIYYPLDGSAVSFIAYYPYVTGATFTKPLDIKIATDQTKVNAQPKIDLMYATADNSGAGFTKTTLGAVGLTFSHKLSKLVMNCTANATVGISNFDNVTVTIKGMNTQNTFDLSNGMLETANTIADITPRKLATANTFMASYDAIIMPGSYAEGDVTVDFTVNNETFTWVLSRTSPSFLDFYGGYEYVYSVTLSRTEVKVTGTISPWTSNNRGNATAK